MVRIRFPPAVSLGTRAGPHGGGGGTTRKQGRLLDRALRGAPSLKPGVSSLLKLSKASTRVSNSVSRRSVLRTRPQRERDRKFADSARSQFEATQEEVQPASARDFSMSRENPAISCSSSPSAASGKPRKPPLQVLHEELLPLPSTDGTLQLRNRWFADSSLEEAGFEPSVPLVRSSQTRRWRMGFEPSVRLVPSGGLDARS